VARRPLTTRRLLGLDRSGPPPPETLSGQPLNPWTIPNAIGITRLALLPVFLVVALSSDDGHSTAAFVIYAFVACTDYLDGMAARITGQYSRLGTLLDPLTDRALVISGAIVCWKFELLPRWALAVLAARELLMLILTRIALKRGIELQVKMLGRWAVWPVMSALALALVTDGWVPEALLYFGLALTLGATAEYLADGWRYLRPSSSS
jgi:cardiolipin synthase